MVAILAAVMTASDPKRTLGRSRLPSAIANAKARAKPVERADGLANRLIDMSMDHRSNRRIFHDFVITTSDHR